ncbi:MAG: hypothetical protein LW865_01945 [Betaproteobacteria bacterium]|jgi:hypothetical protein|nr:hypothetical protein [Betaproteobacteria bacterium]
MSLPTRWPLLSVVLIAAIFVALDSGNYFLSLAMLGLLRVENPEWQIVAKSRQQDLANVVTCANKSSGNLAMRGCLSDVMKQASTADGVASVLNAYDRTMSASDSVPAQFYLDTLAALERVDQSERQTAGFRSLVWEVALHHDESTIMVALHGRLLTKAFDNAQEHSQKLALLKAKTQAKLQAST